jgi:membrane-associated protein
MTDLSMAGLSMAGLPTLAVSAPVSYAIAFLLPAADAVLPVLPSETAVIALGVATAGSADPRILALIALAAAGAFAGDSLCYLLGRRFGGPVERRLLSGDRGRRRREWAEHSVDRFGARLIITCRFVPGCRTVVTLICGLVGYPYRRFMAATACGGAIWASYAFLIGRIGGQAFQRKPWAGLLLGLGAALAISLLIEALRRAGLWRWLSRALGRPQACATALLDDGSRGLGRPGEATGCAPSATSQGRRGEAKGCAPSATSQGPHRS